MPLVQVSEIVAVLVGVVNPVENKSLNLSPEQEAQLKGLRVKFLEETAYLRSEIPIKLAGT